MARLSEVVAARDAVIEAARKFRDQYESEADAREDYFLVDPGCLICTSGTTPHHLDTGTCGYHATCNALALLARLDAIAGGVTG